MCLLFGDQVCLAILAQCVQPLSTDHLRTLLTFAPFRRAWSCEPLSCLCTCTRTKYFWMGSHGSRLGTSFDYDLRRGRIVLDFVAHHVEM